MCDYVTTERCAGAKDKPRHSVAKKNRICMEAAAANEPRIG
jgi:hypothetical protein